MPIDWDAATYALYYDVRVADPVFAVAADPSDTGMAEGDKRAWAGNDGEGRPRTGHEGLARDTKPTSPTFGQLMYYRQVYPLRSGYGKAYAQYSDVFKRRAKWIIGRLITLGLNETHSELVAGSGFGYLIHAFYNAATCGLAARYFTQVWGL